MPVDNLEVLVRQLDGALRECIHVQACAPARGAGRGDSRDWIYDEPNRVEGPLLREHSPRTGAQCEITVCSLGGENE